MLFNSLEFILFFVIVTSLYFALPHKFRWLLLLVASCLFYMAFIPVYILILGATIVVDYFAGIYIEKFRESKSKLYTKRFLILSLVANIGVLAVFKYYNFFIDNCKALTESLGWHLNYHYLKIMLPIGLSFHTFQAMSYTIEVYRGNQKAEKHFGIYALYVMFYPQLVAGPIERPQNMIHQFKEEKKFNYEQVKSGLLLMLWGMFKKVVIADRIAGFVDPVFNNPQLYSPTLALIAALFFSYQIYCDFSGYCDIAIGSARVMGIELMKNFDNPYHSISLAQFWSKWNISLSTWFRDYLYIPLGGNRVAKISRYYFNILFVFFISGLWHGASWTFIIWGLLHGFYMVFASIKDKILNKKTINEHIGFSKYLNIISVFFLVTIASVFFRVNSVEKGIYIVKKMTIDIVINIINIFSNPLKQFVSSPFTFKQILLAIGFIFLLEIIQILNKRKSLINALSKKPILIRWAIYYSILICIIAFGVFEKREFYYFQF